MAKVNVDRRKPLVRVDGRADPDDLEVLRRANYNISSLIRSAIRDEATQVRSRNLKNSKKGGAA